MPPAGHPQISQSIDPIPLGPIGRIHKITCSPVPNSSASPSSPSSPPLPRLTSLPTCCRRKHQTPAPPPSRSPSLEYILGYPRRSSPVLGRCCRSHLHGCLEASTATDRRRILAPWRSAPTAQRQHIVQHFLRFQRVDLFIWEQQPSVSRPVLCALSSDHRRRY